METPYSPVTPSIFRTVLSVEAVISETNNGDNRTHGNWWEKKAYLNEWLLNAFCFNINNVPVRLRNILTWSTLLTLKLLKYTVFLIYEKYLNSIVWVYTHLTYMGWQIVVTKTKTVRRHLERLKVFVRISYSLKTNPKTTLQINASLSQVTQIKSCPRYSIQSDEELGRQW